MDRDRKKNQHIIPFLPAPASCIASSVQPPSLSHNYYTHTYTYKSFHIVYLLCAFPGVDPRSALVIMIKLYSNYLSSCTFRVRIALRLKGIDHEYVAVDMLNGEHLTEEFLKLNPLGMVPALVDGDIIVADSFAILMYLEEMYPQHPLLPNDPQKRALNYQAANIVSSNIQPLQNPRIQKYIGDISSPDEMLPWSQHHICKGFAALEKLLNNCAGKYATGDEVSLADCFIAPQVDAASKRFKVDMNDYPLLSRLYKAYQELPAFKDALPENQPDSPAAAI